MKLKKGSIEAKRFMAKIRAMKSGTKKKATKKTSIGATKFVEKKEPKNTKPKRTIQITRKADGTFKKFKQIGSIHKDTKSHNVRVSVVSGLNVHYSQKITNLLKDLNKWKTILSNLIQEKKSLSTGMKPVQAMYIKDARNHISTLKKEIVLSKKHIK